MRSSRLLLGTTALAAMLCSGYGRRGRKQARANTRIQVDTLDMPGRVELSALEAEATAVDSSEHYASHAQVEELVARVEAAGSRHGHHPAFSGLAASFTVEHRHHFRDANGVVMPALAKLATAIAKMGKDAPASQHLALARGYILASQIPEAVSALRNATDAAIMAETGQTAGATAAYILHCLGQQELQLTPSTIALNLKEWLHKFPSDPDLLLANATANVNAVDASLIYELAMNEKLHGPSAAYAWAIFEAVKPDRMPPTPGSKVGLGLSMQNFEWTRRMVSVDTSSWELRVKLSEIYDGKAIMAEKRAAKSTPYAHHLATQLARSARAELVAAMRASPGLASSLEGQYMTDKSVSSRLIRASVEVLRKIDPKHDRDIAAAAALLAEESLIISQSSGYCSKGTDSVNLAARTERLRPPRPDHQNSGDHPGQCPRMRTTEAAEWIALHKGRRPVVVIPDKDSDKPPAPHWAEPSGLTSAAGNETFRVAWLHSSRDLNIFVPPKIYGWSFKPELDVALVRPPMAFVSVAQFVNLMTGALDGSRFGHRNNKTFQSSDQNSGDPRDAAQAYEVAGRNAVYLNQRALPNYVAPLLEHYPELAKPPRWAASLGERALPHLWLGKGKVVTGLHTDAYHNVMVVHAGRKSVLLFAPEQAERLYYRKVADVYLEYNITNNQAMLAQITESENHGTVPLQNPATGVAWGDAADDWDELAATHPRYQEAGGLECEVAAGDAVFIPQGWHHALLSHDGPSFCAHAAVNYWFGKET